MEYRRLSSEDKAIQRKLEGGGRRPDERRILQARMRSIQRHHLTGATQIPTGVRAQAAFTTMPLIRDAEAHATRIKPRAGHDVDFGSAVSQLDDAKNRILNGQAGSFSFRVNIGSTLGTADREYVVNGEFRASNFRVVSSSGGTGGTSVTTSTGHGDTSSSGSTNTSGWGVNGSAGTGSGSSASVAASGASVGVGSGQSASVGGGYSSSTTTGVSSTNSTSGSGSATGGSSGGVLREQYQCDIAADYSVVANAKGVMATIGSALAGTDGTRATGSVALGIATFQTETPA